MLLTQNTVCDVVLVVELPSKTLLVVVPHQPDRKKASFLTLPVRVFFHILYFLKRSPVTLLMLSTRRTIQNGDEVVLWGGDAIECALVPNVRI